MMAADIPAQEYSEVAIKDRFQTMMQNHRSRSKPKARNKQSSSKPSSGSSKARNAHLQQSQTMSSDDSIIYDVPATSYYQLSSPESENEQFTNQFYLNPASQHKSNLNRKKHPTQMDLSSLNFHNHYNNNGSKIDINQQHTNTNASAANLKAGSHHPQPTPRRRNIERGRSSTVPITSDFSLDDADIK